MKDYEMKITAMLMKHRLSLYGNWWLEMMQYEQDNFINNMKICKLL